LYLVIISHAWSQLRSSRWVWCATLEPARAAVAHLFEVVCATKATESVLLRRSAGGKEEEVGGGNDVEALFCH